MPSVCLLRSGCSNDSPRSPDSARLPDLPSSPCRAYLTCRADRCGAMSVDAVFLCLLLGPFVARVEITQVAALTRLVDAVQGLHEPLGILRVGGFQGDIRRSL